MSKPDRRDKTIRVDRRLLVGGKGERAQLARAKRESDSTGPTQCATKRKAQTCDKCATSEQKARNFVVGFAHHDSTFVVRLERAVFAKSRFRSSGPFEFFESTVSRLFAFRVVVWRLCSYWRVNQAPLRALLVRHNVAKSVQLGANVGNRRHFE